MKMSEATKLRKRIKNRKPDFIRQDGHKKARVGKKWRKPKGTDSKQRLKLKGHTRNPSKGYRSPKEARGKDASGLEPVSISNLKELKAVDKDNQGIIIKGYVALKKKLAILKKAVEANIKVLNIRKPEEFVKKKEALIEAKKKEKDKKLEEKDKKEKEKERKSEEKKEDISEKVDEEEKKEEEKKEKDRVLTKKDK